MKKYFHQKLVRDNLPRIIKETGGQFEMRIMGKNEFKKEIKKKLVEEVKELTEVSKERLLNELADVWNFLNQSLLITKSVLNRLKNTKPKREKR